MEVAGVLLPSYKKISLEGQIKVLESLYAGCEECRILGEGIMCEMAKKYPKLGLGLPCPHK